jgi:hypothetical protein
MVTPIINQPLELRRALECTNCSVVLDIESTGLTRNDILVSVGVLVDNQPYINFIHTRFIPVITRSSLQHALAPLATRSDLESRDWGGSHLRSSWVPWCGDHRIRKTVGLQVPESQFPHGFSPRRPLFCTFQVPTAVDGSLGFGADGSARRRRTPDPSQDLGRL